MHFGCHKHDIKEFGVYFLLVFLITERAPNAKINTIYLNKWITNIWDKVDKPIYSDTPQSYYIEIPESREVPHM